MELGLSSFWAVSGPNLKGDEMKSKVKIYQSPLSGRPNVPAGKRGTLEDVDTCNGLIYVDFGEPYGIVACEENEVLGC